MDGRYIYHDEWECSGNPGYCADLQDTFIEDCGQSQCSGTCPGCTYTCDIVAGRHCSMTGEWLTNKANRCTCTDNSECDSGLCKSGYEGEGKWCAGSDQCVLDGVLYEDGIYADCIDESNLALCSNGSWVAESCGDGYCQAGLCYVDSDGDGLDDMFDNCPAVYNPDQADMDYDGIGDACDNCWYLMNIDQLDSNNNCPQMPFTYDPECGDACEVSMCPCPGDLNGDGWFSPIDVSQLVSMLLPYASSYYWTPADPGTCGQ